MFQVEFEYMYEWDLYHTIRQTRAVGTGNHYKILETLMKFTTGKTSYCYDNIRIFHQPIFHISEKLTLKSPRTQVQNSDFYASIILRTSK